MSEETELADEIMRFLEKHAKSAADYDPDHDDPAERYSSPDATALHVAAAKLRAGMSIDRVPWSEWASGGYAPYTDTDARSWHNDILDKITGLIAPARPVR